MKQIHLTITGRVQGVFFRAFVKENAQKLGVNGWARNKNDGTVEVLMQGDAVKLKQLVDACKKGPDAASVETVQVDEQKIEEEFDEFEITQ